MHGLQEGHRDQNRPGILHQKEKALHRNVWCFFVVAKRVRAQLTQESAVHGLQEGHRDQNRPGILHQKEKAPHGNVWCFSFYTDAEKGGSFPQKGKPPPLLIIG